MTSRSDLEMKSRLALGLGLLSLVAIVLLRWLLPVVVMAIPLALIGAGSYWIYRLWQRQQQRQQRQQQRLDAQFYQLLKQRQGLISVLDLAMSAQINGSEAQAYLNAQAQAFSAHCKTTLQGDIVYVFSAVTWPSAPRVQDKKAQAAWVNAKQLRTLRQLSQLGLAPERRPKNLLSDSFERNAIQPVKGAAIAPLSPKPMTVDLPAMVRQSPAQRARVRNAAHSSEAVVTIDVPAVRS